MLLAGIGHVDQQQKKNFLIVDGSKLTASSIPRLRSLPAVETQTSVIEASFQEFTERKDIAILLINQHVGIIAGRGPTMTIFWDDVMLIMES